MMKFFLILILIFYVFYKIGGFILKVLYAGQGRPNVYRQQQNATTNGRHGEIKVDYVPEKEMKKRKSSFNKKNGEYVDFEEIKE